MRRCRTKNCRLSCSITINTYNKIEADSLDYQCVTLLGQTLVKTEGYNFGVDALYVESTGGVKHVRAQELTNAALGTTCVR